MLPIRFCFIDFTFINMYVLGYKWQVIALVIVLYLLGDKNAYAVFSVQP